jgi:outer membrane protein TolC
VSALRSRAPWLWVSLLVALVTGSARAQDSATPSSSATADIAGDGSTVHTITLADAIARARAEHPRMREAAADESVSRARLAAPAARWLPRLGATLQAVLGTDNNSASNWLSSGGAVEMPRIAGTDFLQDPSAVVWTPYLSTAVGVGLDQEVFDFGRIDAARRAAEASLEATQAISAGTTLEIDALATQTYVGVQAAHEVLRAAEQARRRADEVLRATQASVAQGLRAAVDVTRAQAEVARFAVAVAHATAALHVARAQLAGALGATDLELDAEPIGTTPNALPSLTTALAAIPDSPELRVAEAEARAASARVQAAEADLLPDLRLIATLMSAAGGAPAAGHSSPAFGAGAVPFVPNYFAGLVLRWNFFDAVRIAERDVATAEAEAARARTDTVREDARILIEQAWYTARGAEVSLDALTEARDAAVASYDQIAAQYQNGLASALEMADAANLRTSAEVDLAVGRFQLEQARAELERRMAATRAAGGDEVHE